LITYRLTLPHLDWDDDGAPHSTYFNDIYFDKESGIEETQFVFLKHNQLEHRFTQLNETLLNTAFTIAETGFGTGLNFLCAWQLWQNTIPNKSAKKLHFISVEKYPLSKDELIISLAMWPTLKKFTDELIQSYPVICKGLHRVELDGGRIQLSLWFGDANEGFAAINADVDAWFLDGFSPSKNPDMWNPQLFAEIKRLSHIGTSISTFTAAGIVRRGLQSVGFDIQKVKGFGKKREMLIGNLMNQTLSFSQRATSGLAWFHNRTENHDNIADFNVLVIGAGLAGCHTANALAKKEIQVTIWDQHSAVAKEASGNPQGILYPKLAAQDSPINRFYLTSYLYANRTLNNLQQSDSHIWSQSGLEQRPTSKNERDKFTKLLDKGMYPQEVVDRGQEGALFLPLSGWITPKAWCEKLIQSQYIHFKGDSRVTALALKKSGDRDYWSATTDSGVTACFTHVIFCTANSKHVLQQFIELPIKSIRGQVSSFPLEAGLSLDKVLCQEGYVSPPFKKRLHFGSSYGTQDDNTETSYADHKTNLAKLEQLLPNYNWQTYLDKCDGRVSFRCSVADYVPIIGPIPNIPLFTESYKALSKNAKWTSSVITPNINNLYINIGHGSRGLISTPLAGEYLASLICNEVSVYEREIEHAIHPARFLVRSLKKGKV